MTALRATMRGNLGTQIHEQRLMDLVLHDIHDRAHKLNVGSRVAFRGVNTINRWAIGRRDSRVHLDARQSTKALLFAIYLIKIVVCKIPVVMATLCTVLPHRNVLPREKLCACVVCRVSAMILHHLTTHTGRAANALLCLLPTPDDLRKCSATVFTGVLSGRRWASLRTLTLLTPRLETTWGLEAFAEVACWSLGFTVTATLSNRRDSTFYMGPGINLTLFRAVFRGVTARLEDRVANGAGDRRKGSSGFSHVGSSLIWLSLYIIPTSSFSIKAAGERHANGNFAESLRINRERFGMSPQLAEIFENTMKELDW